MDNELNSRTEEIQLLLSKLDFRLPQQYIDYLIHTNRGSTHINQFTYLYGLEELLPLNLGYHAEEHYPGYFLIGSDGGLEAFAIEKATGHFVMIPFIGMEDDAVILAGRIWDDFLEHISHLP